MANPVDTEVAAFAATMAGKPFPYLSPCATPDELRAGIEWLLEFADGVDAVILTAGQEFKSVTRHGLAIGYFRNVLTSALSGIGTYEIERCAELEQEEAREFA